MWDTRGGQCLASFTGLSGDKKATAASTGARPKVKTKPKEAECCKQQKTKKNSKRGSKNLKDALTHIWDEAAAWLCVVSVLSV